VVLPSDDGAHRCGAGSKLSTGAYDAQIFTNDREKLGAALGHDVSHSSAHAPEMKLEQKQEQAGHAAAGDRAEAGAELRFWLGSLVKRFGLRTPCCGRA
jgi:hypothetical protein